MYTEERQALNRSFGTNEDRFSRLVLGQLVNAVHPDPSRPVDDDILNAAIAAVHGIQPRDELEAMLAAQMFTAHHLSMRASQLAMNVKQNSKGTDRFLNHAAKFMRVFASQVEALQKYRGKGRQRMTVEHVHVHSGGQAVVGSVEGFTEGGRGGETERSEEQPHEQ